MPEFTTRDGCRIAYDLTGPADAPVLMLGNPIGTTFTLWEPLLPILSRRQRVLRFDTRGHGASNSPPGDYSMNLLAQDVLGLLDHLGLAQVAYAGVSLGGMIGQAAAAAAPDRFSHLIPICTTAHYGDPAPWASRIALIRQDGLAALLPALPGRWFTEGFIAGNPDRVAAVQAMVADQNPDGYIGCCAAIRDMDLRASLPRITAATLVIVGAFDPATPPVMGEAIAAGIPGARLVMLPCSHLAHVEAPNALATSLLKHLEAR